jgi:hypothetical protein
MSPRHPKQPLASRRSPRKSSATIHGATRDADLDEFEAPEISAGPRLSKGRSVASVKGL